MSGIGPSGQGAGVGAGSGALLGATIGSIIPGVGTLIGAGIGAALGGTAGAIEGPSIARDIADQGKPNLSTPTATSPASQGVASTTSIQSQLSKEQNARSTATLLTQPGGLTDEPTTTSSLLTGA